MSVRRIAALSLLALVVVAAPAFAQNPGACPPPPPIGVCIDLCPAGDASCGATEKCCSNGCGFECVEALPLCGDGFVATDEQCDDGGTADGDGCSSTCRLENDGRKCQAALHKASRTYAKKRHQLLLSCYDKLNEGTPLFSDQDKTVPVTLRGECETEFKTARGIAKAAREVRKVLAGGGKPKCTDTLVASLDACASTVDGLIAPDADGGCLLTTHDAAVDSLLSATDAD